MDALLQDLTCPITLELFVDPVSVPCCGKAFSRASLTTQLARQARCPLCNADLLGFDAATSARNSVLAGLVETVRQTQAAEERHVATERPRDHQWSCSLTRMTGLGGRKVPVAQLRLVVERSKFTAKPSLFIAVVDRSGSMSGSPWKQVETALLHIMGLADTNGGMVKTVIVAYDSSAAVIDTSGPLMQVNQRIRTMFTGGGTNFLAAFACVQEVLAVSTGFSSVNIAFMTDGQACGNRDELVGVFAEQLQEYMAHLDAHGARIPVTVHAIGFGSGCDKAFLEGIRQVGSTHGTFRYAEPADVGDALCGKLTGLFEWACRGSLVPVRADFERLRLRNGAGHLEFQLPVKENGKGEFSCWVQEADDLGTVTLTSEHDMQTELPVVATSEGAGAVFEKWLANLADELAAEVLTLPAEHESPDLLELACALLQQRTDALAAGTQDAALRDRLEFIGGQLASLRAGTGLHVGKLNDLRFSSCFAAAPAAAPVPSLPQQPRATSEVRALKEEPAFEQLLKRYSRSNIAAQRSALQEAIASTVADVAEEIKVLLADASDVELLHRDINGNTALHLAAYCGHSKILGMLLERAPGLLDLENNDGETAVTLAIKKRGFERCLLKLQAAGAMLPRKPLLERFCIEHKYVRTARILSTWGDTALKVSATMSPDHIKYLYDLSQEKGISVDAQSYMEAAVAQCMHDLVEVLLSEHDARPSLDMLLNHCIPPKPDDPETAKYIKLAELLLESDPALINMADPAEQETPLFRAALKGSLPHVRLFIARGARVDQPNVLGNTALWVACAKRYPCIVSELLDCGADPNIVNLKGNAPMSAVCQRGPRKVAEQLIARGANLELINKNGDTFVLLCCRNGQPEVLRLLLNYASDEFVKHKAHIDGFSAVLAAAEQDQPECVRVLHEFEADLEQKTELENPILPGAAPLHVAAYYNRSAALAALLEAGASPDVTDASRQTPLHTAVIQGHTTVIKKLLYAKADIAATDLLGNRPASYCRNRADILQLLVNPALDVLLRLARGAYAEKEAEACKVLAKRSGAAGCLLTSEAVDLCDQDGSSVLTHAVLHSRVAVVRALVDLRANPCTVNKLGLSPLLFAEHIGNQRVLASLRRVSGSTLDPQGEQQLSRLRAVSADRRNADAFFLGAPVCSPAAAVSTIPSRMQGFVGSLHCGPFSGGASWLGTKDTSDTSVSLNAVVHHLKDGAEFAGVEWAPDLWNAKLLVTGLAAAGVLDIHPQEVLLLSVFTSNPCMAQVLNTALARGVASPIVERLVSLLSTALKRLPPFQGEAYVGARLVDRRLFDLGNEFHWPAFWSASSVWRVATEAVPEFTGTGSSKAKRGTVFIVKSRTGRLISRYSPFPCDAEVVFAPSTLLRVTNWYHGDVIALGQANIREGTFSVRPEERAALMHGDKSLIIELEEAS